MLLEFRVKNFKSLRDEAVLSLVASKDDTFEEHNTRSTGVNSLPKALTCAAIYGANASGKSNLISALAYMKAMVVQSSGLQPDHTFNVKPFLLSSDYVNEPTEFELTIVIDGIRYQYGFAMNSKEILEEWLLVYKNPKPQNWFYRTGNDLSGTAQVNFGSGLTGPKETWRKATRNNSLFLSTAVSLNSKSLEPLYMWITKNIEVIGASGGIDNEFTINMIQDPNTKNNIIDFLSSADISIEDINIERQKGYRQSFSFDRSNGQSESNVEETEILQPRFTHKTKNGEAHFQLHQESLGTQRLFSLAGPLLEILDKGKILVFDELNNSLHTILAQKLVQLFSDKDLNKKSSQIIFTTHDTAILDANILRRDQIWLMEKDNSQASLLFPLTEYSPRKTESLGKGYLMGRYGAIPLLKQFFKEECRNG